MENTETKTFQHFKFTLPILKTRIAVEKVNGVDVETKFVEGVASSTDLDLHGDRMDPSAIKSMADSLKYHLINLNADHDTTWSAELGDISKLDVSETNQLLIEAKLNKMSKAEDLWLALTEMDKKLGLSIGGYVKEYEMVKEDFKNEETGEVEQKWVKHYKNIELDHIAVTSSPANPKTWVGAIAKSIKKDSEVLIKKLEEKENKEEINKSSDKVVTKKEQKLRDLAREIARAVQDLEADLLLELTYAGLNILSESQIKLLDNLLIVRSLPMDKKNVSLEAEESLKKDEAIIKPEGEEAETEATLDNEPKEEATTEVTPKDGESTEAPAEQSESKEEEKLAEEKTEEEPAKEETEESKTEEEAEKAEPKDGDECTLDDGSKGTMKNGKCVAKESKSEEKEGSEEEKEEETVEPTAPVKDEAEKSEKSETTEKTEEKTTDDLGTLLKSVVDLTNGMKKVLENNETLAKRVAELENQPSTRKTVELEKGLGDDDSIPVDVKSLKQEMEEKIAEVRKNNYGNPNLFAMTQKIRAEYAQKMK